MQDSKVNAHERQISNLNAFRRVESTWQDLPAEIVERIASFLPQNELACTIRLINKATAILFRRYLVVRLSQRAPEHSFHRRWRGPGALRGHTFKERRVLLALTARSGSLTNLQVAVAAAGCPLAEEVFDAAAAAGHLDICQWLAFVKCPMGKTLMAMAAKAGCSDIVRWLLQMDDLEAELRRSLKETALVAAASAGHLDLCCLLLEHGTPCNRKAICAAALCGHAPLTQWLLPRLPPAQPVESFVSEGAVIACAAFGFPLPDLVRMPQAHPATLNRPLLAACVLAQAFSSPTPDWRAKVDWLEGDAGPLHVGYIDWDEVVVRPDCMARVQMLRQRGADNLGELLRAAIRHGNQEVLRFARAEEPDLVRQVDATAEAASDGNVAVLVALVAAGWPIRGSAVRAAARGGHMRVLRWLTGPEVGPAGGEAAVEEALAPLLAGAAAASGSLEVVVWLRERGCPWDEYAFATATASGNMALMEWMVAEGCPMGDSGEPYVRAGRNGDLATLHCLRRLGCPWGPDGGTFHWAVFDEEEAEAPGRCPGCSLEVLRWMCEQGCPVDWRLAKRRAERREDGEARQVLAWIGSHIPPEEDEGKG